MRTEYLVTWVQEDGVYQRPFLCTDKVGADEFVKALQREDRAVVLSVRNVQEEA